MLTPLRRSLGERILESSQHHCKICIRHLHNQHPLRGPATAEAQVAEEYLPPLKSPQSTKGTASNFTVLQNRLSPTSTKRSKSAPKPLTNVASLLTNPNKSTQQKTGKTTPNKAAVAFPQKAPSGTIDPASQFGFDLRKVRSTYPAPDEAVLPRRVEYLKKNRQTTVSHKVEYESEPLRYIEDGLKIRTKIEFAQLRGSGFRVRLTAAYHKDTLIAMGDGETKVCPGITCVY
jgi:hypothetical protein